MDNQIGVGMGHRLEDRQEETDSARYIQTLLVAVTIDVLALDKFQNKVGLAGRRDTSVH